MSETPLVAVAAQRSRRAARCVVSFSLAPSRGRGADASRAGGERKAPQLPGSLKNDADARFVDPHRCRGRRSPSSPARPSSARASRPRSSRSRPKSWTCRSSGSITLVTADTARTPNEGYTAGSQSMQDSGTAIMHAAAQVREILIARGGAARSACRARAAHARSTASMRCAGRPQHRPTASSYRTRLLHVEAQPRIAAARRRRRAGVIGKSMPRVDIPAKVDRRRDLRSGPAPAGHGACARRAPAELRRAACQSWIQRASRGCRA